MSNSSIFTPFFDNDFITSDELSSIASNSSTNSASIALPSSLRGVPRRASDCNALLVEPAFVKLYLVIPACNVSSYTAYLPTFTNFSPVYSGSASVYEVPSNL